MPKYGTGPPTRAEGGLSLPILIQTMGQAELKKTRLGRIMEQVF